MNAVNLLTGGALLGVLAACWGYIKGFAWRMVSMVIQRVEVRDGLLPQISLIYMLKNYKKSSVYDRTYRAMWDFVRINDRRALIPYEEFGRAMLIFWNGWRPVVVSTVGAAKKDSDVNANDPPGAPKSLSFTFLRGTFNVDNLIEQATKEFTELTWSHGERHASEHRRFFIKYVPDIKQGRNDSGKAVSEGSSGMPWWESSAARIIGYENDELGHKRQAKDGALDSLVFPNRILDLIEEVKMWRASREWYIARGIPWKRGWLLYGPPGTGKTALARAFAEDLDMPIYVFNLAELGNHDFMSAWIEMTSSSPCIALIEDIDNVFDKRTNISPQANMGMMGGMMGPFSNYDDEDYEDHNNTRGDSPVQPGGNSRKRTRPKARGYNVLTFDCFLNTIDGVERGDGVFTIITTNNLSKIDSALGQPQTQESGTSDSTSTRPGRIDRAIELTFITKECGHDLAKRILSDYPEELTELLAKLDQLDWATHQETPAQFQERCAQIALHRFWLDAQKLKIEGNGSAKGYNQVWHTVNGPDDFAEAHSDRVARDQMESDALTTAAELHVMPPSEARLMPPSLTESNDPFNY